MLTDAFFRVYFMMLIEIVTEISAATTPALA